MGLSRSIIKVFLASPGDLKEERVAAKRIVEEENTNHANAQGYHFELVGWEDTVAQHGRAQEIINRDLDQCNFFVGVLWKRWGSPPGPSGGKYTSGFEEEYERSQERHDKTGKPTISILLKTISEDDKRDIGPQLNNVLEFRKRFTEGYSGVYQTFDDSREFEQRFRSILAMFLRKQIGEDTHDQSEEKSREAIADKKKTNGEASLGETLFEEDSREFVKELVGRPPKGTDYEYTPAEAARFRLLASTLQRSQNDDETLGVHDANLMYQHMKDKFLSEREKRGLVKAGLAGFATENSPFWHWLYNQDRAATDELVLRTFVGTTTSRRNALRVLTLISDSLHELKVPWDRNELIAFWLEATNDTDVRVAALSYLGHCGSSADLEAISECLKSSDVTVSRAAVAAKIQILIRESVVGALDFIASREDAEVPVQLASRLLANPSVVETGLLKRCLTNRSTEFCRLAARELLARKSISIDEARALTQSVDARTRAFGAKALRQHLFEYTISDAKSDIVKPKAKNSLSFFSSTSYDFEGEEAFEDYRHEELCQKGCDELRKLRASESMFQYDISFAIYDHCFKNTRDELIENIRDDFKAFISRKRDTNQNPLLALDDKTETYLREKLLQKALELLCAKAMKIDLDLVREKIDAGQVAFSESILSFLQSFGDWDDVARIIRLCNSLPFRGNSLLSFAGADHTRSARAMLKLGQTRMGDLLAMDMPAGLRSAIFRNMSKKLFASFDDGQIEGWLRSDIDNVRKTVSLKAVLCLPKARLRNILKLHSSGEKSYFYNAVFWLDMGLSTDKATSNIIAQKALDPD